MQTYTYCYFVRVKYVLTYITYMHGTMLNVVNIA